MLEHSWMREKKKEKKGDRDKNNVCAGEKEEEKKETEKENVWMKWNEREKWEII